MGKALRLDLSVVKHRAFNPDCFVIYLVNEVLLGEASRADGGSANQPLCKTHAGTLPFSWLPHTKDQL